MAGHFRRKSVWTHSWRGTSGEKVLGRDGGGLPDYNKLNYLVLGHQQGFFLHTIEGDIEDLSKLLEGETIIIQGQQYLVTKDGFKLVQKT